MGGSFASRPFVIAGAQVTRNVRESEAWRSPSEQSTMATAVPAPVAVPTIQVQETSPVEPAVRIGARPLAVEIVPEAYTTLTLQVAPAEVAATIVAFVPGRTDAVRFVIVTAKNVGSAVEV